MSELSSAGNNNTPNIYLTNANVGEFSLLSNKAITDMLELYRDLSSQTGVNQRALAGAKRIIRHLTFEEQYRAGAFDPLINQAEATMTAGADLPEGTPPGLVSHRVQ